MIKPYVKALIKDIKKIHSEYKSSLNTLYIGGGSPSVLDIKDMSLLITEVKKNFGDIKEEFTVELNPKTLDYDYLSNLYDLGVNRISMGVQSFDGKTLNLLGRKTKADEVLKAVDNVRKIGFKNLNLDLIYGIPLYDITTLKNDLNKLISLEPEHISTYCLSLEEGTPLDKKLKKYNINMPSDDETADQLEVIIKKLAEKKYNRYEISNFSKKGKESKHNMSYWEYKNTLGSGASAVYTNNGKRVENVSDVTKYMNMVERGDFPYGNIEEISLEEQQLEYIMMGMRLSKGISKLDFKKRFGKSLLSLYGDWIKKYKNFGFLVCDNDRIYFTDKGLNISNGILAELFLEKKK